MWKTRGVVGIALGVNQMRGAALKVGDKVSATLEVVTTLEDRKGSQHKKMWLQVRAWCKRSRPLERRAIGRELDIWFDICEDD